MGAGKGGGGDGRTSGLSENGEPLKKAEQGGDVHHKKKECRGKGGGTGECVR